MTREVLTVSPDSGLGVAARALEAAGVSGAPVVEGGKVVGIVTLQDLLSRAPATAGEIQTTGPFHRVEHLLTEISTRTGVAVRDVMTAASHDTGLIQAEEGGDRRGGLGGISQVPRVRV